MKGSDNISNKKKKLIALGVILFLIMTVSGIYALTNQTVDGIINTGIVDIEIREYILSDGETPYDENEQKVNPGEKISLIPKIHNLGENCYIRIKVKYINEQINFENYVEGFSNDWEKNGEYYYYKNVFNSNDIIKIFDKIKIPENIDEITDNKKIKLEIIAEAIQEKNINKELGLAERWDGITPTKTTGSSYDINTNGKTIIIYEDDTNESVFVKNTFLENIKRIMPGDVFSDYVEIKNKHKSKASFYFKTELETEDAIEVELLNRLNLTVKNSKGEVVYNGKVLINTPIQLGEYDVNEYDKLEFKVEVPIDLDNKYVVLSPDVKFIFSGKYENETNNETTNDNTLNPKTGDNINVAITIFIVSAIGLVVIMVLGYIEKRKEEY